MSKGRTKQVRAATSPSPKNKRIADAEIVSTNSQAFRWDTSLLDHEVSGDASCDWTWDISAKQLKEFLGFLKECSERTWSELESDRTGGKKRHKKHHNHSVGSLCPAAQKRFRESVKLDESFDTVWRLRYGGEKRIWGVRDRALFRLIWLDLNHQVYPSDPN